MQSLAYRFLDPEAVLAGESFDFVHAFLVRTGRMQIGWHYIVDLAWIHSIASHWPRGGRILDAGGGRGPAQFLLAEMGFHVVNIDLWHATPGAAAARRYSIRMNALANHADDPYVRHLERQGAIGQGGLIRALKGSAAGRALRNARFRFRHENWRRTAGVPGPVGSIELVQADLCAMPQVADCSFDGVVSLSALEHIPIERLPLALAEIERVLKPGAPAALTTSGSANGATWYHEPSQGECFSEQDIQRLFGAASRSGDSPAAMLQRYRDCAFLRGHLADFYRHSGDNGMPWGKWDPTYVPVALWR